MQTGLAYRFGQVVNPEVSAPSLGSLVAAALPGPARAGAARGVDSRLGGLVDGRLPGQRIIGHCQFDRLKPLDLVAQPRRLSNSLIARGMCQAEVTSSQGSRQRFPNSLATCQAFSRVVRDPPSS